MKIARPLLDEIIDHARRDAPNECCGVIATRNGAADAVRATRNVVASPLRFEIDGLELYKLIDEFEDAGAELAAVYHSHVRTDPYPSQTDINFAERWPGLEWLIVGLGGDEPSVRSYRIDGGRVEEVGVEVV